MNPLTATLLPLLLLGILSGCSSGESPGGQSSEDYAPWITGDPAGWPRVAMVNRIIYSDSSHFNAGSAFLLETGDGIVAVTAKHVLRHFKSEPMDSVSFRGTLQGWGMFPKDFPGDMTVVDKLLNEDADEFLQDIRAADDWLLFSIEKISREVKPLRLRPTPMTAGETVFVVGWRYTDGGPQHVYRGEYVRSEEGSLLIDVEELADNTTPGLSGAPVLDARGYVVGLMSSKSGELQRVASIDYPRKVLERKRHLVTRPEPPKSPAEICSEKVAERAGRRGWVGITPGVDAAGGIIVAEVFGDSPAQRVGIQPGDLIRGLNGQDFRAAYELLQPRAKVRFDLERDGEPLSVNLRVERIPDAVLEQWISRECGP